MLFLAYLGFAISKRQGPEVSSEINPSASVEERFQESREHSVKSQIELTDFNRVEVREVKKIWAIQASNAKFFKKEGLTHVSDIVLEIFREKKSSVKILSKAARLAIENEIMEKVDLEGDIKVRIDESLSLRADFATYDSIDRVLEVPGKVKIYGTGYELRGNGFRMKIDGEKFFIRENASTMFRAGAKVPEDLQL